MQSVSIPIYPGLFGNAKCLHAHMYGAFWQCKVSSFPNTTTFSPCKVSACPCRESFLGDEEKSILRHHSYFLNVSRWGQINVAT